MNVCIVGGGPAGMMLGFLLARAGIEVAVLEKHPDFLRDFRGDTVHPSTIELMHELGLLDDFLSRPHQVVKQVGAQIGDDQLIMADFTHLPVKCPYIALMPQWDFLNFIAEYARKLPAFHLHMETEATGLIKEGGRVVGVRAKSPQGPVEFRAGLVVGADGRSSTIRESAGFKIMDIGAPMDVLWMRISRRDDDPPDTLGRIKAGHFLVLINRESYWQCAYLIPKGTLDAVKRRGLSAFRDDLAVVAPFLRNRLDELKDWDQIRPSRSIGSRRGTAPGCSASATPRTPCRPSAAWASTWPSRMPSRPPICSGNRCVTGKSRSINSPPCSSAANGRRK
jgi:2-polyprenyl-6-methoxyphenol hydroxylase-like FAD-dependent oxidoreductase